MGQKELWDALNKRVIYTAEDMQHLREQLPSENVMVREPSGYIGARVGIELWEATTKLDKSVQHLDDTSTRLINTTNRLTGWILVLTVVGVLLTGVGAWIAVMQYLHK